MSSNEMVLGDLSMEDLERKLAKARAYGHYFGFEGALEIADVLKWKHIQKDIAYALITEVLCEAAVSALEKSNYVSGVSGIVKKIFWKIRAGICVVRATEVAGWFEFHKGVLSEASFKNMSARELEISGRAYTLAGEYEDAGKRFEAALELDRVSYDTNLLISMGMIECAQGIWKKKKGKENKKVVDDMMELYQHVEREVKQMEDPHLGAQVCKRLERFEIWVGNHSVGGVFSRQGYFSLAESHAVLADEFRKKAIRQFSR